jgi:hypothetical protein
MRSVIGLFIVTRLALAAVIMIVVATMPLGCPTCVGVPMDLLGGLTRWDADAYLDIARNGYTVPGRESHGAYSPLYPVLVRVGATLLGGSDTAFALAGVVIANAALLVALWGVLQLARPRIGEAGALRAATYVLVFPTTIFLTAAYAESLFLAFSVLSALEADRTRWWRSGIFAALAALTRPFGALAVLPLIFAYRRSFALRPSILAVGLAPLAFFAWAAYLWAISGDPLQVVHVYAAWGSHARSPIAAFADLFDPRIYGFPWVVLGLLVLFIGLIAVAWRRWGAGFGTFGASLLLVVASSGSLTSSMRYELAIFPAFIALSALTGRPAVRIAWTILSVSIALLFAGMYALYYWIG